MLQSLGIATSRYGVWETPAARTSVPLSPPLLLQIMTAAPQQFHVDILPVDDGTPRIVTNLGLQWLEYMDGKVCPIPPAISSAQSSAWSRLGTE